MALIPPPQKKKTFCPLAGASMMTTKGVSRLGIAWSLAASLFVAGVAYASADLAVYNYANFVDSAEDVPDWVVDVRVAEFGDQQMLELRAGICTHAPIYVHPKLDGSTVLTCGTPAQIGPMVLITADRLSAVGLVGASGGLTSGAQPQAQVR